MQDTQFKNQLLESIGSGGSDGAFIVHPVFNENYTEATLYDADNNTVSYNILKDHYNSIMFLYDESGAPSTLSTTIFVLNEFQYTNATYSALFANSNGASMVFEASDIDAALTSTN